MTPLANVIEVGLDVLPALDPEPRPEPAEAADHAVDHQQDAVLGAQVGDALDVALRRRMHAARADHRLAEERGHAVRPDAQDLGLERLQRVELAPSRCRRPADPSWSRSPRCRRRSCRSRACRGSPACARSGGCARAGRAGPSAGGRSSPPCRSRRRRRTPRNTRASSIGATPPAARRARWPGGCRSRRTSSTPRACASARATASTTSVRPWPMFAYQRLAVPSR